MKRILVISWFFPPVNSSEGLVTYKLLNNSRYEYDIYMQNNNSSWSYGMSKELNINKNIKCIESEATDLETFKVKAIEYFKQNASKYDIVMTRSMPEISHVIGLQIKKIKNDITWIASFGDPIGNNPFTLKALMEDNPHSKVKKLRGLFSPLRIYRSFRFKRKHQKNYNTFIKSNNILQEQILNACDYVIYNNPYQKDYMLKDYKNKEILNKKNIIIPHSYDLSLYHRKNHKNDKITFTYVGHLDDIRTPHELFIAIEKLKNYDKNISDKITFKFYGNLSDKEKLYLTLINLSHIPKV